MAREVTVRWLSGMQAEAEVGPHRVRADAAVDGGGSDAGPSPGELLLSALGACKVMTARQFAERRKWPLTGICAHLTAENVGGKYGKIEVELTLEGDLTDEQRQRLRDVAERCLVSKTLAAGVPIVLR